MSNKAHTATLNRISLRYGLAVRPESSHDIETEDLIIEVETSASLDEAIERLKEKTIAVYVAVTNKEGLNFAVRKATGTNVGVMDPQGNVVLASGDHPPPTPIGPPVE